MKAAQSSSAAQVEHPGADILGSSEAGTGALIDERRAHVSLKHGSVSGADIACDTKSVAGAVSQRACVYSGARVVLNPIADVAHIIHGPLGCAAYTWDIRGSLSSGDQSYRTSFSTAMGETDVIFGGEPKLARAIRKVADERSPAAIFVFSTCVVGVIGDDIGAVCKAAEAELGIPVIPVRSEGFKGNKSDGYKAACDALFNHVIGREGVSEPAPLSVRLSHDGPGAEPVDTGRPLRQASPHLMNILGEFNIAGDLWEVMKYFEAIGIDIQASVTGDGRFADVAHSHRAALNLVQCSGSMTYLAKKMEARYGIPFKKVSFFGLEDMGRALIDTASFFEELGDADQSIVTPHGDLVERAEAVVRAEEARVRRALVHYRGRLEGRRAAVYMGGPAKALSLVKAFRDIGMEVVVIGTQSAKKDDYQAISDAVIEGTVIIDDANPIELRSLLRRQRADIMVGGVKERYLAYKLGVPFCDFNHDRDLLFAGYDGMIEFAREVDNAIFSPVWALADEDPFAGLPDRTSDDRRAS